MGALTCLVLSVFGLLLLATPALPLGLVLVGVAAWGFTRVSSAADETFVATLMAIGTIGAFVVAIVFLAERMG